jgi:hypothetical protein
MMPTFFKKIPVRLFLLSHGYNSSTSLLPVK